MTATTRIVVLSRAALIAIAALAVCASAAASDTAPSPAAGQHYEGAAYANDSERLLYREEHWVYDDHGTTTRLVLYRCPSGTPFARKIVRKIPGTFAPDFDFFDSRNGYREGVRSRDGAREIYVQRNAQASVKTAPLPARAGGVIDAGFDTYVRSHWSELADKQDLHVPFLVPSRFDYLDVKLGGAADSIEAGEAVRHLHMQLDTWFGAIAPSIDLTYAQYAQDAQTGHRLLRFQGIGSIRDANGKPQTVRIEFPASRQFGAPVQQDIDAAAVVELSGACSA
jgi:hypothetical protein